MTTDTIVRRSVWCCIVQYWNICTRAFSGCCLQMQINEHTDNEQNTPDGIHITTIQIKEPTPVDGIDDHDIQIDDDWMITP